MLGFNPTEMLISVCCVRLPVHSLVITTWSIVVTYCIKSIKSKTGTVYCLFNKSLSKKQRTSSLYIAKCIEHADIQQTPIELGMAS